MNLINYFILAEIYLIKQTMTKFLASFLLFLSSILTSQAQIIITGGNYQNDFIELCKLNEIPYVYIASHDQAVRFAKENQGIVFLNDATSGRHKLNQPLLGEAIRKNLRIFTEFYMGIPDINFEEENLSIDKERGVVLTDAIPGLDPMDILSINNREILVLNNDEILENSLLVFGKVAGYDKAEYGLEDTDVYPLLFHANQRFLVSSVKLSNMLSGRFGPSESWEKVFNHILGWLLNKEMQLKEWPVYVQPAYGPKEILPDDALMNTVIKGTDWFFNAKLLVHESWEHLYYKNTGVNGKDVVNPPVENYKPVGNGLNGILEGHASRIGHDGNQPYRWWIRADAQAETAFALSSAFLLTDKEKYAETAKNLLTYLFERSNLTSGERANPASPSYGLIGWATTDPDAYYGDDNARALLGVIGTSTNLNLNEWDEKIIEGIISNYRTAGVNGFRGPWFRDAGMQKTTWQKLGEREIVNVHPHYESWLWGLYIWLYDKTGYDPFLYKAKEAISITMKAYPEWKWTNGIQQEYARMILPLSWLVRVENNAENKQWLDMVVSELLKEIDASGAIPEKFGKSGLGRYEKIGSNEEYGTKEAPLISSEEDRVSDLLYTMNFAFFSLNEAYHATNNHRYAEASSNISEFLIRIQIDSKQFQDLDGGWFRAFDYGNWEYWASNADSDWGPWGTLTGWTQSWIINGLVNQKSQQNLWDLSKGKYSNPEFKELAFSKIKIMLEPGKK